MGFKPSEKVLVALRGVYNLPFNLDDPVSMRVKTSPLKVEKPTLYICAVWKGSVTVVAICQLHPSVVISKYTSFVAN